MQTFREMLCALCIIIDIRVAERYDRPTVNALARHDDGNRSSNAYESYGIVRSVIDRIARKTCTHKPTYAYV